VDISSAEQARQLQPAYQPATDASSTDTDLPSSSAGDPDDDSFGSQQILKGVEHAPLFDAFAGVSAFFTNNVALTHRQPRSDSFLEATAGLSVSREITDTLELDLTGGTSLFRYARFDEFDLNSLDAGVGLSYRVPKLWDASLYAGYSFSDLLNTRTNTEFFENHDFTLGAEKTVGLSRALNVLAGISADCNLSDPAVLAEDSVGGYAGVEAAFTSRLQGDLDYRYSYEFYTEGTRRDGNQLLTLSLQYKASNWLSIMGTTYLTINHSNEEAYSYEALAEGLGLSGRIGF
jgi:hypothetical protein